MLLLAEPFCFSTLPQLPWRQICLFIFTQFQSRCSTSDATPVVAPLCSHIWTNHNVECLDWDKNPTQSTPCRTRIVYLRQKCCKTLVMEVNDGVSAQQQLGCLNFKQSEIELRTCSKINGNGAEWILGGFSNRQKEKKSCSESFQSSLSKSSWKIHRNVIICCPTRSYYISVRSYSDARKFGNAWVFFLFSYLYQSFKFVRREFEIITMNYFYFSIFSVQIFS